MKKNNRTFLTRLFLNLSKDVRLQNSRSLKLEHLEDRQLLAADLYGANPAVVPAEVAAENVSTQEDALVSSSAFSVQIVNLTPSEDGKTQLAKPAAPTNDPAATTADSLKFDWTSVENAAGYKVQYSINSNFKDSKTFVQAASEDTSYTATNLVSDSTYYFRVKALGDDIAYTDSVWSDAVSGKTDFVAEQLDVPANFQIVDGSITAHAVGVSWTGVENAATYTIEYDTTDAFDSPTSVTVTGAVIQSGLTHTFSGMAHDTTYYFRIKAIAGDAYYEDSDWSSPAITATTLIDAQNLNVPTNLTTSLNPDKTKLTVIWTANNTNQSGFQVEYTVTSATGLISPAVTQNVGASVTSIVIDNPTAASKYSFKVKALGDGTYYFDSNFTAVKDQYVSSKYLAPTNFAVDATKTTEDSVTLTWDIVGQASYKIQYSTKADFSDAAPTTVSVDAGENTATIDGLTSGTKYYFRIQSIGDGNFYLDSDFTTTSVSATTDVKLSKTTTFSATPNADKTTSPSKAVIDLLWAPVANAGGYVIQYSITEDFSGTVETINTSGTKVNPEAPNSNLTYEVGNLTHDTTYYFRLKAVNTVSTDPVYLDSDWSEAHAKTVISPVKLDAPSLTITDETAYTADAAWTNITNSVGYQLQCFTVDPTLPENQNVQPVKTFFPEAEDTTWTMDGLTSDTTYWCRIMAYGDEVEPIYYTDSDWSNVVEFKTDIDPIKLDTPTNFTVTPDEGGNATDDVSVSVEWDAVDNATGYTVRYSIAGSNEVPKTITFDADAVSGTIDGLNEETEYTFEIKANGTLTDPIYYTDSDWSAAVNVTTEPWLSRLDTPVITIVTADTTSITVTATWEDVTAPNGKDATGYMIQCSTDSTFLDLTKLKELSIDDYAGSFVVTGLDPATEYYFRVKGIGDDVYTLDSYWSNVESETTYTQVKLDVPDPFEVVDLKETATSVTVTWGESELAVGYEIQYSTDENFDVEANIKSVEVEAAGEFTVDGLLPETTYYFRVKALAGDDNFNREGDPKIQYVDSDWATTIEGTTDRESIIVTTLEDVIADDGETSLREAINWALDGSIKSVVDENVSLTLITFRSDLAGGTILLQNGEQLDVLITETNVNDNITIDATNLSAGAITPSFILAEQFSVNITVDAQGVSRVFNVGEGITLTIDGLGIANGKANYGGGVMNRGALTLENCSVTGNTASYAGGGIYSASATASLTLAKSEFVGNTATAGTNNKLQGGAVYMNGGVLTSTFVNYEANSSDNYGGAVYLNVETTATFNANIFSGNSSNYGGGLATASGSGVDITIGSASYTDEEGVEVVLDSYFANNSAVSGGAVLFGTGAEVNIVSATFDGNTASSNGGALTIGSESVVTIDGCDFTKNSSKIRGGAIYTLGDVTITNRSQFNENTAAKSGGAVQVREGSLTVQGNSTFINNESGEYGGAIDNFAFLNIDNCDILYNASGMGGAILNRANMTINESLIQGNDATIKGGAIMNEIDGDFVAEVTDTIITGNTAVQGGAIHNTRGAISFTDSMFFGNFAQYGGAFYAGSDTTALLDNCNIWENVAAVNGGGLYLYNNGTADYDSSSIKRNIVFDPMVGENENVYETGPIAEPADPGYAGSIFADEDLIDDIFDDIDL